MRYLVLIGLLTLAGCSVNPAKSGDVERPLETRLEGDRRAAFIHDYAGLLAERGRYDEAARLLEQLRRDRPGDLSVVRQLAHVYEKAGRPELALTAWDQVLAHSDDRLDAAEYARLALRNERFALAEAVFQGWLQQAPPGSPDAAMALNNLGYSRLLQGDYPAARRFLEQALARDPLHTRARANLELVQRLESAEKEEVE